MSYPTIRITLKQIPKNRVHAFVHLLDVDKKRFVDINKIYEGVDLENQIDFILKVLGIDIKDYLAIPLVSE